MMPETKTPIKAFTDLIVWRRGHELVLRIYQYTKDFPREELFGLSDQIRRASVSITSNIAEGFARQTLKEKIQFYYISQGSVSEVRNQLTIARDLKYISLEKFKEAEENAQDVGRLLTALIQSIRSKS